MSGQIQLWLSTYTHTPHSFQTCHILIAQICWTTEFIVYDSSYYGEGRHDYLEVERDETGLKNEAIITLHNED